MIKIFHNNRCKKSREGLEFLKSKTSDFEIVDYLNNPPNADEMKTVLNQLGMTALEMVRKNEDIWKQKFKGKEMSEEEIINAMIKNPKLIERPIIIKDGKAVLARPVENIEKLFQDFPHPQGLH